LKVIHLIFCQFIVISKGLYDFFAINIAYIIQFWFCLRHRGDHLLLFPSSCHIAHFCLLEILFFPKERSLSSLTGFLKHPSQAFFFYIIFSIWTLISIFPCVLCRAFTSLSIKWLNFRKILVFPRLWSRYLVKHSLFGLAFEESFPFLWHLLGRTLYALMNIKSK